MSKENFKNLLQLRTFGEGFEIILPAALWPGFYLSL